MDILFVTHRLPWPPDKGDRIRSWHLLRYLATLGEVRLVGLSDEPVPAETLDVLRGVCREVRIFEQDKTRWLGALGSVLRGRTISEGAFSDSRVRRCVRDWSREVTFDGAVASASSVAPYIHLPELRDARKVVDLVDVDSRKWLDYAAATGWPKSLIYRTEGRRLAAYERRLTRTADALTLVSAAETALFAETADADKVRTATNGVDLEYYRPMPEVPEADTLAFVGAFDYKPNVDGAIRFAREVWPTLHANRPGLKLQLVGRKPVASVLALAKVPGIEVVGQVPDVRPYVAAAKAAIAPLDIARGLQNKVLEALAMGKPVVASPHALGGFARGDDFPALCAYSPADWVTMVGELLRSYAQRDELGRRGRRYAETHHEWHDCLSPFGELLRSPEKIPC